METLAIAKTLQKIDGIEHDEAYNIAEAINGRSGLATREDLSEVKTEIAEVIAELKEDIAEVKTEIAKIETSLNWMKAFGVIIIGLLLKIVFFP